MHQYRRKDNPTTPHHLPTTIIKGDRIWCGAPGAELSTDERVFFGEYLDVSPIPAAGYRLGIIATWNELLGTVEMNMEVIPSLTELEKKALITSISNAAKTLVEDQANAALQIQQWENYKSATPHPYVVANINWGKAIYMEAEVRKSQVQAGIADDYVTLCDFSSFGDKPYTVYQLYTVGAIEL